MALIGYARVSTEDQATFSQLDELKAAGCAVIFEKASGGSRARPELAKAIAQVKRGDIRDCLKFRVRAITSGPKEAPHGTAQTTQHSGRAA